MRPAAPGGGETRISGHRSGAPAGGAGPVSRSGGQASPESRRGVPRGPHGPILRRIFSYLRPAWVLVAISLALTLVNSGLNQIPQLVNRYLIDRVLLPAQRVADPLRVLVAIALGLLLLRLVLAAVAFGRSYTMRIVGQNLVYGLRRDIFRSVQYLSTDFYIHAGVGQIMSRVMNDTGQVQNFITSNLSSMLDQLFTFVVSLVILEHYDPHLTDALLLFGPPIAGSILLFSDRLRSTNRAIRRQTARLTAAVHDALAGFVTVKAFAAEEHVISAFEAENIDLFARNLSLMRLQAAFNNTMGLVTGSSGAFFLMYGGWQVLHGTLSLGTYVLVNGMRASLFLPFTSFAGITASYQQAAAGAERIFEYMDTEPSVRDRPGAPDLPPLQGAVEFSDVVFHYPPDPEPEEQGVLGRGRIDRWGVPHIALLRRDGDRPNPAELQAPRAAPAAAEDAEGEAEGGAPSVPDAPPPSPAALDGVSFTIRPGETVGLVGPSGGGKSTVAGLIARFYDCDSGAVLLDGRDVREVTLRSLRRQVAVVLQDVYLFRATVRDNVAFGLEGVSDADIDAALRAANAHFVWDLPAGPETMVGEGGMRLSGGQRQRVAIARALLRRPRLLVLDEATSAQDTLSENAVMDALAARRGEMTILVIAHRLSTITHADRILVLESGRLVEQGRHSELLAAGGLYAQLYGAQAEAAD